MNFTLEFHFHYKQSVYKSGPSLKHLLYIAETEGPADADYRSWSSKHLESTAAVPAARLTILVSDDLDPSELVTTVHHHIDDGGDDDEDDLVTASPSLHSFATSALASSSSSANSKVCTVCNKSFSRAWSLQRHMTDRHFYVPQHLECDICGRTYRSRNSLISHKSQYHGAGVSSKVKDHHKWSCIN